MEEGQPLADALMHCNMWKCLGCVSVAYWRNRTCAYLAHHGLESIAMVVIVIFIVTSAAALQCAFSHHFCAVKKIKL